MGLAMEQHMPLIIFDAMQAGNLARVVRGEALGTSIG
jgi:uridylate kinase